MSDKKKISVRCIAPQEAVDHFAAARGRVEHALISSRRPITYAEALKQVQSSLAAAPKK